MMMTMTMTGIEPKRYSDDLSICRKCHAGICIHGVTIRHGSQRSKEEIEPAWHQTVHRPLYASVADIEHNKRRQHLLLWAYELDERKQIISATTIPQ